MSDDDTIHKGLIDSNCQSCNVGVEEEDDGDGDGDGIDNSHVMFLVNAILCNTAYLNFLLPTTTMLVFTIFSPLLTNEGHCDAINRWEMGAFVLVLAASCLFLSLTDSFKTASGRVYYGVATWNGIWTFSGRRRRPIVPSDYRLRWSDLFHAGLCLVAFLTYAGFNYYVYLCFYPWLPRTVRDVVPLAAGFVVSVLFVKFPSKRRGIGYPFFLQRDGIYYRM